jgi:hypothetical protein
MNCKYDDSESSLIGSHLAELVPVWKRYFIKYSRIGSHLCTDKIVTILIFNTIDHNLHYIDRTTNCCEWFHSKLNKDLLVHILIFYFMETLNSIQTLNYIIIRSNNQRKLTSNQERSNKYVFGKFYDWLH